MTPLLLLLACTAPDPPPPPGTSTDPTFRADSADTGDTPTQLPDGFTRGDPIQTLSVSQTQAFYEHLDAAQIAEDRGIVVSNNGFVIVDLDTGEVTLEVASHNGFQVEWDPTIDVAWVGTKVNEMWKVDVSDPDSAWIAATGQAWQGGHADLDCEDGRVLVSAHDEGAFLLDEDFDTLAVFPATYAVGAGLVDGIGVITDLNEVVLIDWTDPTDPVELDRLALRVTGWDVDFDGTHVAVAQGSEGVAVLSVVDQALVLEGELTSPGGVYGVSLDADNLWATAWSQVMLIWLGGEAPVVLGHEPSNDSAMALGSVSEGRVLVADWKEISVMGRTDFVAGAEIDLDDQVWLPADGTDSHTLTVLNGGAEDLDLSLTTTGPYTLDPADLVVAPGEREWVQVRPTGTTAQAAITWTSNDPDEPSGSVQLALASTTVGLPHPDFSLESFTPPDPAITVVSTADLLGEIAYIGWFSPT